MSAQGKYVSIPKKDGRSRVIFVPDRTTRKHCRDLLPRLHDLQEQFCDPNVVHGFYRGRSPVTNAEQHVGYRFSVCFDLSNFFHSVTEPMVRGYLVSLPKTRSWMFTDSKFSSHNPTMQAIAEQGLPTSPLVANIAAVKLDQDLVALGCRYTRYADDLTFSTNDEADIERLLREVPALVAKHGFAVNPHKTHVLRASQGRRIITGVAVDDAGLHVSRAVKRRLRAARHNGWHRKARGLEEWAKLKRPDDTFFKGVVRLAARWTRSFRKGTLTRDELNSRFDGLKLSANTAERQAVLDEVKLMCSAFS